MVRLGKTGQSVKMSALLAAEQAETEVDARFARADVEVQSSGTIADFGGSPCTVVIVEGLESLVAVLDQHSQCIAAVTRHH